MDIQTVDNQSKEKLGTINQMTPKEIVAELDNYIIGQDKAKRAVAIALRNRWRRQEIDSEIAADIMPAEPAYDNGANKP